MIEKKVVAMKKYEDKTTGVRCKQCGEESPGTKFETMKVIHRKTNFQTGKQFVGETLFTVCANGKCGGHLQMAYEG